MPSTAVGKGPSLAHRNHRTRQGWAGRKDSELLSLIMGEFDVFVTMDSNLIYQQSLPADSLCVIVLQASNSCYETLLPLVGRLTDTISHAKPGTVIELAE